MSSFADETTLLEHFWDKTIPVNVSSIVESLSISLIMDNSISNYSCSYLENSKRFIAVKIEISEQQKRFGIAHSLAHHALNHSMPQDLEPSYDFGINYFDIEANSFAVNLLIPTDELNKVIKFHTKNKMINIETLSSYFDVPYGAMYLKLKLLGHGD